MGDRFTANASSANSFSANAPGTLMWIGSTKNPEFRDAFEFCGSHVGQIAVRASLEEAVRRPASAVRWILIAQSNRQSLHETTLERVLNLYPEASVKDLLGTLCEGMPCAGPSNGSFDHLYWHRWNQELPSWLQADAQLTEASARCNSVAVLCANPTQAEPLLDLVESTGATAIWCRSPRGRQVRNVDAAWWDDSVAPPTSEKGWQERLSSFDGTARETRHVWIATAPRLNQHEGAIAAGVEMVVSKPHRLDPLLTMLTTSHSATSNDRPTLYAA